MLGSKRVVQSSDVIVLLCCYDYAPGLILSLADSWYSATAVVTSVISQRHNNMKYKPFVNRWNHHFLCKVASGNNAIAAGDGCMGSQAMRNLIFSLSKNSKKIAKLFLKSSFSHCLSINN